MTKDAVVFLLNCKDLLTVSKKEKGSKKYMQLKLMIIFVLLSFLQVHARGKMSHTFMFSWLHLRVPGLSRVAGWSRSKDGQ